MIKKSAFVLATFFGSGLAAKAPGTFGSLATLPPAFVMAYFFGREGVFYAALISFFTGVWAIHQLIKDSDDKDPSKVVIDETAGQLTTQVAETVANIKFTPKMRKFTLALGALIGIGTEFIAGRILDKIANNKRAAKVDKAAEAAGNT